MYKIILDCDLMRYRDSGLYHYCLNLGRHIKMLLEEEEEGHISFYVPSAEKKTFGKDANCITEKFWHHKYVNPFLWDCNIWHAPFQSGRIIIPPKNKSVKILLTIHDLNCLHEDIPAKEKADSLQKTQKLIDQSDNVVCISNHCKNDVMNYLDVKNKPIHVIHNGTHHVTEPPVKPVCYMPSRPFLFTMGYVNRKKNFHSLLPLLKNNELDLIVAGKIDDTDYQHAMWKQARLLGVSERLHILGPVSEEDKAWYLKNCLAFLLPSLAEGFGATVVEAMKFGKPIFLSNLTSLPEIGGDVAFYFNSFEPGHMQEVLSEGLFKYNQNGLAARIMERCNEYDWKQKAIEYLAVYRSMV